MRFWTPRIADCHVPKKPRNESDDVVRVVSHARNDAVGGGEGGGGRRVMVLRPSGIMP